MFFVRLQLFVLEFSRLFIFDISLRKLDLNKLDSDKLAIAMWVWNTLMILSSLKWLSQYEFFDIVMYKLLDKCFPVFFPLVFMVGLWQLFHQFLPVFITLDFSHAAAHR